MGAGIELRQDYGLDDLRALARRSKDANQSRRLLALAAVLDGHARAEAAKIGAMDRQTLRDWVHRFNGSGPEGLVDRKAPGQAPKLSRDRKAQLVELVDRGPILSVHGSVRSILAVEFRLGRCPSGLKRLISSPYCTAG